VIQLILHLIGDYILQSDWMANNKTKSVFPAITHAVTYSLPFLILRPSILAFAVILTTHFIIDHWRLARYVVFAKNYLCPPSLWKENAPTKEDGSWAHFKLSWENCKGTGYPSETPAWLAVWLLIIADNAMHLLINYLSLRFL
jgi:hypothetical protein